MIPNQYIVLCGWCKRVLDRRYAVTHNDTILHHSCKIGYIEELQRKK